MIYPDEMHYLWLVLSGIRPLKAVVMKDGHGHVVSIQDTADKLVTRKVMFFAMLCTLS